MATCVLLLEPDLWRYLGISHVLSAEPEIQLLGEKDYNKILGPRRPPKDLKPDVAMLSHTLLIDFKLPLLVKIKEIFPQANILVFGYEANVSRIAKILAAGAKGYFLLSLGPEDLVEALRLVGRGLMWAPGEALALMVDELKKQKGKGLTASTERLVTPYEITILKMLKQGMSNKEIAGKLGVAEVTVKAHLAKLYRRFNVHTRLQLLSYAIDRKLIPG